MLPSWERILYFHIQPALLDAMVSLAGVLLLLKLFRVRNPSIRAFFLFIPLVRPLLILLEGAMWTERFPAPNMFLGVRIPDPFNMIPSDIADSQKMSTMSSLIAILLIVTIVAALAILAFRWLGFLFFYRRLRQESKAVQVPEPVKKKLDDLIDSMSKEMGLQHSPEILYAGGQWMTPCAIGWRHPAIVIDPRLLDDLEPEELKAVMAHELSHIRRRDGLWHWISILLRDVQAFNPFTHVSISRLGLEREKACDRDAVEILKVPPRMLAECLVKVARLTSEKQTKPLPGYGFSLVKSDHGMMESRIKFLLGIKDGDIGHNQKRPGLGWGRKAALLAVWLPMVSLQLYACIWLGGYAFVIK